MKATTFDPINPQAEAFITPDPVQLTIGALVNRLLDRQDTPQIIIIDQVSTQPRVVCVSAISNGTITPAATFEGFMDALAEQDEPVSPILFEPGDEPGAPFEG